jgi:hypothetical protein
MLKELANVVYRMFYVQRWQGIRSRLNRVSNPSLWRILIFVTACKASGWLWQGHAGQGFDRI